MKQITQALIKYLLGIALTAVLLFIPAESIDYWNAWLLMGLLFVPMFIIGLVLIIFNPELLKKRLKVKEKESEQKVVVVLSGLMFVLGFVIAGLNFRYKWIVMPNVIVIISSIIFFISYILYAEVLRENTFLSRTIEVQENQKVIDTGLYGIIRHPMYAATILLFLSIPLILNSLISFIIFLFYPIIIAKRINNEEKILEKELKGYTEYKSKVKYKLIPFVFIAIFIFSTITYAVDFPEVNSKIVEVYDITDDKILYEKDSNKVTSIASITKIATTMAAIETIDNLDEKVIITKSILDTVNPETSVAGLKEGDKVTYRDLLYATLVPSGADAAHSIAILSSGSMENHVEKMNDLVNKLGLRNTHFSNVTGLEDENHYSTVDEIRKLLVYALKNPTFREIYKTKKYVLSNGLEVKSTLYMYNIPLTDIGKIMGSKTGYLENLGYCLTSLSNVSNHEILTINMGAQHVGDEYYNIKDNIKIIDFLDDNYSEQILLKSGEIIKKYKWSLVT